MHATSRTCPPRFAHFVAKRKGNLPRKTALRPNNIDQMNGNGCYTDHVAWPIPATYLRNAQQDAYPAYFWSLDGARGQLGSSMVGPARSTWRKRKDFLKFVPKPIEGLKRVFLAFWARGSWCPRNSDLSPVAPDIARSWFWRRCAHTPHILGRFSPPPPFFCNYSCMSRS